MVVGLCVGPFMQRAAFAGVLLIAAAAQALLTQRKVLLLTFIAESELASTD